MNVRAFMPAAATLEAAELWPLCAMQGEASATSGAGGHERVEAAGPALEPF